MPIRSAPMAIPKDHEAGRDYMSVGLTWNVNLLSLKNPWKKDDN